MNTNNNARDRDWSSIVNFERSGRKKKSGLIRGVASSGPHPITGKEVNAIAKRYPRVEVEMNL